MMKIEVMHSTRRLVFVAVSGVVQVRFSKDFFRQCTRWTSSVPHTMRAVLVRDKKMFIEDVPMPYVRDNELLIRVRATAVNRADVLQRQGLYPPPAGESTILGLEAVGEVVSVGPRCQKAFRAGDRVMGILGGGGYAEYVASHEGLFTKVPVHMSDSDAAAVPEAWMTAYQLLNLVANGREKDKVIIHAAASGVGTAAVQLARLRSMTSYAIAGTLEKLSFLRSLGADVVINYKLENFDDMVLNHSNGAGADIILDCVGGSFVDRNVRSLAPDGRWVIYGFLGGSKVDEKFLLKLFAKRAQLFLTTLRNRSSEYKSSLVNAFTEDVLPHFSSGVLKPVVDSVYSWRDLSSAHRRMESNANVGKIVIMVDG